MLQLSTVLQFSISNSYIFDFGELSENRIFLSSTYSELYLDPGFIIDSKNNQTVFPPEFVTNEPQTPESNIFSLGLIFLRLCLNIV
jgi:hypothetical protein